jgi:NAD-dependent dihydropyrimidine dehydrogenase PreA subunit
MPSKMALVDFNKCHPESCDKGICAAAKACPRKLMKQEKPNQPPMTDPSACQACADCVRACLKKAIKIVTI